MIRHCFSSSGLEVFLLGAVAFFAFGCAEPLVLRVPALEVNLQRVVAIPADAEVSLLEANGGIYLKRDWSAVATADVNEVLRTFLEAYGLRMFDEKSVAGTRVSFNGFREWAMTSLIDITNEMYNASPERHQSVGDWRWRANLDTWRRALNADFILVVLFQDTHRTAGAVWNSTITRRPLHTGIGCIIDMGDGRIIWCEEHNSALGDLRTQSGVQSAVDTLLTRFFPAGRPKGSRAFRPRPEALPSGDVDLPERP